MKKPKTETCLTILTVVVIFAAWFLATGNGNVSKLFIPAPADVWKGFLDVLSDGYKGHTLLEHLGTSMQRLVIANLLCVVTAVPIGLLSGYNSKVRALLEPIIEFYRPLAAGILHNTCAVARYRRGVEAGASLPRGICSDIHCLCCGSCPHQRGLHKRCAYAGRE